MAEMETCLIPPDSATHDVGAPAILFVTYGWHESGGGTLFPRAVARELAQRGYRIAVVYASLETDPGSPPCALRCHEEDGVRLFGIINRPALFTDPDNPEREIDDPAVREAFCRVLELVQPDLVHFHNFHGLTFSLAEETYRRTIPACFTPHNYHLIDPELYLLKSGLVCWDSLDLLKESDAVRRNPHLYEWYRKRGETTRRLMNQWVGMTLAVSHRQKELLCRFGGDPSRIAVIHQISPVADVFWLDSAVAAARTRTIRLPLKVGYIGTLIPIKGVQMLVAAGQSFTSDELEIHLYGSGNREYEQNLRAADVRGLVTFHGGYRPEELSGLAGQIDLAVIPSLVEESAPTLVLSELFALGVPVIAAGIGGIPEFISEGVDGILYQPYDLDALTGHLRTFVNAPALLAAMRRNLTGPAHTFARYMERLEVLYRELLSGSTPDVDRISLVAEKRMPAAAAPVSSVHISWHGGLFVHHSLAHVNRELCLQLLERGCEISYTPTQPDEFSATVDSRFAALEACRNRQLQRIDITLRHQWPPDFSPPPQGKLVVIQPWEYGSVPAQWVADINAAVDELWVPSSFVRDCYLQSGVEAGRVQVVPNGVATDRFHPGIPPARLNSAKKFRFLFVGGTIQRKGIDILLAAYSAAFTAEDDVCLVIKDMGGGTIYRGQTAEEMIAAFQRVPGHPEVVYLDEMYDNDRMAALYTACHCLVHPYRGEGFGLPIAEAMACGLAPIVTGYGAALDFCPPEIAWLIPATLHPLPAKLVGNLATVDLPWLAEPDMVALTTLMRHACDHPDEVRQRGSAASRYIREHVTWDHAARIAEQRLRLLVPQEQVPGGTNGTESEVSMYNHAVQAACLKADKMAQRGDVDAAVQIMLHEGILADANSPVPYLALTTILLNAGRFQEALGVVSEMPPATDERYINEINAQCYCALGDDTSARDAALLAGKQSPLALVVLGTLAARTGDSAQGEQLFRQALAIDSTCGKAWLSLGMILWSQGKSQEAWESVRHAVEIDPLHEQAVTIFLDISKRLASR